MPWKIDDVDKFKKGLTKTQKKKWVRIANGLLRRCLDEGGELLECEVHAVRIANTKFNDESYDVEKETTCHGVSQRNTLTDIFFQEVDPGEDEYQLVFPIGTFQTSKYGEIIVTQTFCDLMVQNWKNKVLRERQPYIDEMHNRAEAMGWILDMETRDDGLYVKIEWTELGEEKVEKGIYKYFSADISEVQDIDTGEWIWPVLIAVTLCNTPVMNTMPQIHLSDSEEAVYQLPYPGEHAARVRKPGDFDKNATWKDGSTGQFRRSKQKDYLKKTAPKEIHIIWGKLKGKAGQDDPPIPQAIRFKKDKWTVTAAEKWLKDNDIKHIKFEKAKPDSKNTEGKRKHLSDRIRHAMIGVNNSAHSDGIQYNTKGTTMDLEEILKAIEQLSDEDKKAFYAAMTAAIKPKDPADDPNKGKTTDPKLSDDNQALVDKLGKLEAQQKELLTSLAAKANKGDDGSITTQLDNGALEARMDALEKQNANLIQQIKLAAKKEKEEKKNQVIEAALKACKIKPADKEFWEKRFDKDPDGITDILDRQTPMNLFVTQGTGDSGDEFALTETAEEKKVRESLGITAEEAKKYADRK